MTQVEAQAHLVRFLEKDAEFFESRARDLEKLSPQLAGVSQQRLTKLRAEGYKAQATANRSMVEVLTED